MIYELNVMTSPSGSNKNKKNANGTPPSMRLIVLPLITVFLE
jgi:hypothetical protein